MAFKSTIPAMAATDRGRCGIMVLVIIVINFCCFSAVSGFSDGSKLAKGSATTRAIYCNRQPHKRGPLHFDPSCNGYCQPRSDFDQFYSISVSNFTYWLDVVRVNISAKPQSGKALTGFSIYAIDERGHVAGSFVEDDTDVVVGTCKDLIAISDETHAGFHKMANHSRKNVSIQWQPDGYNHGRVKFVVWVVNNHSDIYSVESPWLTSQRHGSETLDVRTSLDKMVASVDIGMFENSFKYRSTKGYNLDLSNPFSVFAGSPSQIDFVPVSMSPSSNVGSNPISPFVTAAPASDSGNDVSSTPEIGILSSELTGYDGSVSANRDIKDTNMNTVNDTNVYNNYDLDMNNMNNTILSNMRLPSGHIGSQTVQMDNSTNSNTAYVTQSPDVVTASSQLVSSGNNTNGTFTFNPNSTPSYSGLDGSQTTSLDYNILPTTTNATSSLGPVDSQSIALDANVTTPSSGSNISEKATTAKAIGDLSNTYPNSSDPNKAGTVATNNGPFL